MNRNLLYHLMAVFFGILTASCTDSVGDGIPVSHDAIEFTVKNGWNDVPHARLNDGKKFFEPGNKVQVFGFHTSKTGNMQPFLYRQSDANRGEIVNYDGTSWSYSPKRYWPKEGTLEFYAGYPEWAVINDVDKREMSFSQATNPFGVDVLWGVAAGLNCDTQRNQRVEFVMKHALAKVNIYFDGSLGDVRQVKVGAYKTGTFKNTTTHGIPEWVVNKNDILEVDKKNTDGSRMLDMTVFILPYKITSLVLYLNTDKTIDLSSKIGSFTFEAGREYNLTLKDGNIEVFEEDANCYVLNPPTSGTKTFEIPIRRIDTFWGNNGYENVPDNTIGYDKYWKAEVLWSQMAKGSVGKEVSLEIEEGWGNVSGFQVAVKPGASGNVVVGVKNEKGTLLWSWHLWITDYVPDRGRSAMRRNLGALSENYVDNYGQGVLYYQFGRKDPFPGDAFRKNDKVSYSPGFSVVNTQTTMAESVKNPMVFYATGGAWTGGKDHIYNPDPVNPEIVWQDPKVTPGSSGKSIFDPSPPGWKVPEASVWVLFQDPKLKPSWDTNKVKNDYYWFYAYGYLSGGEAAPGYGATSANELRGYYWSSTLYDGKSKAQIEKARNMYFKGDGTFENNTNNRSTGMSIRCVPAW